MINMDEIHDDVTVAIAEKFLTQPKEMPWEERADQLANAVIGQLREQLESISQLRDDIERICSLGDFDRCETCRAFLFDADDYVSDPDGVKGCWYGMTDIIPKNERPCYAYRVGKPHGSNRARAFAKRIFQND